MDTIAVLIPCCNEATTIAKVVADYRAALPEATIYVYDNNSSDDTANQARTAGAVVRFEPRQGKGSVLRTMLREVDAACYLLVDGDDTYPAQAARELVAPVLSGEVDLVNGDRLATTYFSENKRPFHNTGNRLISTSIQLLWRNRGGRVMTDAMTGMRAMSWTFAKAFPVLSSSFEMEPELTIYALENRFRVRSIPIRYKDRPNGSHSKLHTLRDGTRVLWTIFRLFAEYRPLLFHGCLSLVLLLIFLLLAPGAWSPAQLLGAAFFLVAAAASAVTGVILDRICLMHRQENERVLSLLSRRGAQIRARLQRGQERTTSAGPRPAGHRDWQ